MILSFLHYDVFTTEPLRGNQLAVFTDGRGLDTAQMQDIAREMNFSESTFILPSEAPGTDVRMRIFTPANEMPMAGHPTIGSTFALAHTGVIVPGASRFVFGLNVGPTPVDLEWNDRSLRFAWMNQALPTFGAVISARELVAEALGLSTEDLASELPIQQVSCGVPYVLVPLRDQATVDRAAGDSVALTRLGASTGEASAIFLFARLPAGSSATIYSRMFAPGFGVPEDPATGSASGPVGCYLVHHGVVDAAAARQMISLQGVAMGRSSRIHIDIAGTRQSITGVKVGGEAVLVGRGELFF